MTQRTGIISVCTCLSHDRHRAASVLITSLVDAQDFGFLGDPEDSSVLGDGGEEGDALVQVGRSCPVNYHLTNLVGDLLVGDGILFGAKKEKDEAS